MSKSYQRTIGEEIKHILIFLAIIWGVFALSVIFNWHGLGVKPRSLTGLVGIVTMPFFHANFGHLLSNTIPLFILLCLLAGSQANFWEIVGFIVILCGMILWVIGRNANHVGASGLAFGLISFLILSGFLERRPVPLLVAIVTFFLYGGTLLWGSLPSLRNNVSWEGHLSGAIAGGVVAFLLIQLKASEKARK